MQSTGHLPVKSIRLKSKKDIDALFRNGKAFSVFPIRAVVTYSSTLTNNEVSVGVTVSKRHFKKATERNRIKRRLRAAWQSEAKFITQIGGIHLFLIFTGTEEYQNFEIIKSSLKSIVSQIVLSYPQRNLK